MRTRVRHPAHRRHRPVQRRWRLPSSRPPRAAPATTPGMLPRLPPARLGQMTLPGWAARLLWGAALAMLVIAVLVLSSSIMQRVQIAIDDLRYGRPRTTMLTAYVGHGDERLRPTQLIAINNSQQVLVIEIPGGNHQQLRTIEGPYLIGADAHLVPIQMELRDADRDGQLDLMLTINRERLIYLNRDGLFRLPTMEEREQLLQALQ